MSKKFTTEEIFQTATTDAGMNKKDRARFHAFNPNGALAQLPPDFSLPGGFYATGCRMLYSRYENFHAKQIMKYAQAKYAQSFTSWDLTYHIRGCLEEAVRGNQVMEEKRAEKLQAA